MKKWDVFISHASEDNQAVVLPLAATLQRAGLRVWLDGQELHIGDSLREKIDEGLAASRFGVVVLSPSFLAKGWPRRELNGLMAIEESGQKVILPVWHGIDKQALAAYSPILADRLAADTERGIQAVASDIIEVVVRQGSGSPSVENPTLGRRFIDLLEGNPDPEEIIGFLSFYPDVVSRAIGSPSEAVMLWSVKVGDYTLDLAIKTTVDLTTANKLWRIVQLERPAGPLFLQTSDPAPGIANRVADLKNFRRWAGRNLVDVRQALPDFEPNFRSTVVAGRRVALSPAELESLRQYNEQLLGIEIRTYDWLVDATLFHLRVTRFGSPAVASFVKFHNLCNEMLTA